MARIHRVRRGAACVHREAKLSIGEGRMPVLRATTRCSSHRADQQIPRLLQQPIPGRAGGAEATIAEVTRPLLQAGIAAALEAVRGKLAEQADNVYARLLQELADVLAQAAHLQGRLQAQAPAGESSLPEASIQETASTPCWQLKCATSRLGQDVGYA